MMRYVNAVDAWGACGARKRYLGLRYRGMRHNTSSCTSREIEALLDQLVAPCTPHLRRIAGPKSPSCRIGFDILTSLHTTSNPPSHTHALQVSGRTPSNCGVSVRVDVTHHEYERHGACPSVKPSTDQPSHVPLHACTLRGAALSSWGTSLLSLVLARRVQGFKWSYGGSQLVLTLYRTYIICFHICNRLVELMKPGDAGIFPLYYSPI